MAPDRYNADTAIHDNHGANIEATVLFDKEYTFKLGGLTFQVLHTPGETYDHASVWIPELKAIFTGDNFYGSFPNMYTLRGTKPRWALDYVDSLNTALDLKPEILIPSHGDAIHGNDAITKALTKYRDAILFVHDETVRGMNAGKDVFTLMNEIALPPELDVGEGYGTIAWSVRGIYDGYMGWFDGNPTNMLSTPASAMYDELVEMAGGADAVVAKAHEMVADGNMEEALHLMDAALVAEPSHGAALKMKLEVLQKLRGASTNSNEAGWLEYGIRETQKQIDKLDEAGNL